MTRNYAGRNSAFVAAPRSKKNSSLETPSGKDSDHENFPVGSILIRPDLRAHVHAFYVFARSADDISDNPLLNPQEKMERLNRFAGALLDKTDSSIPSVLPLRASLRATGVSPQHALDLLTAFKRDAFQTRYRDWKDLLDYCRYSASPVGRHVLALHGIGESAWPANDALCTALQIINHIQDCADDYRELDRVYIPEDMLTRHGASCADLAGSRSMPSLRATLGEMLDALGPMLKTARSFPRQIPDARLKMETSVICVLAEKLVKLLRRRDPLCDNVKLGKPSILLATLKGLLRAWF
ncbi:MAG: squalene synthase HpnC [Alphaproteobacteria bacterium]|nr:squalene synthase HpnC [Alphaproteobacteria bacterium]